ncbi:MAG: hypothetical protein DMD46_06215 [Gemmatimonadetes bacterium]|nr:MAG: hypothetical protein DMD46_06215 [Gemmatimonadota bacterium]
MRRARPPPPLGRRRPVVHQLQPLVRERVQLHVRPGAHPLGRPEAQRLAAPLRVDGQGLQDVRDLAHLETTPEGDRAEVMAVEAPGELGQDGVGGVGRHPLDHQLVTRDAERHRRSVHHQLLHAARHPGRRRRQRRMAFGIHGVLVQGDGEFDQEIGEVARQGRTLGRGMGARARGRGSHGLR